MRRTFVKTLLAAFILFGLVFAGELLLEWNRLGRPELLGWDGVNNAKLVDILSPMARAYNNVLAMLLATIGLAIPLTANMHTPKLIDMFLHDRVNQIMLVLMALGAANVLWVDSIIGPEFAPTIAIRVAICGALLGWAALIPYFFYVVRYLDPSTVIDLLRAQTMKAVARGRRRGRGVDGLQNRVSEQITQIGTIALKSLDRGDRGVALEGVWAFKQLLDDYAVHKPEMPDRWFVVDRGDFIGLSAEALEMLNESRTWYEMRVLSQMLLIYRHALSKASDTVSSVSDANRVIATKAATRGDEEALALCVRYFNNFLREAISHRDIHAMYDVLYQYRILARDLRDRPALLRDIARYFRAYIQLAATRGLEGAAQLASFDLGFLVRRAYEIDSPVAAELRDVMLSLPHRDGGGELRFLVVQAKLILGGFFLEVDRVDDARRVRDDLADVPADQIAAGARGLLAAERSFYEVTDRQLDLLYIPDERRGHLERFAGSVT